MQEKEDEFSIEVWGPGGLEHRGSGWPLTRAWTSHLLKYVAQILTHQLFHLLMMFAGSFAARLDHVAISGQ